MVTSAHIVPEWYFLPFYAILRSVPDKLGGLLAMGGSIVLFYFLPIFNCYLIRSTFFKPFYNILYWFFIMNFCLLGWLGQMPVEDPYIFLGQFITFFYLYP
jgi:ubiquinol-cytochrome c reductase cytochrome b subunit